MLSHKNNIKATHNPIAFAKRIKPPSDRTYDELSPDMMTCLSPPPKKGSVSAWSAKMGGSCSR